MTVNTLEGPPRHAAKQHAAFFRQSGWLMISTVAGGAFTYFVHFLSKRIPESQYSIFGTLLMVTACLPTLPLQMVFAQQTARALVNQRERQLSGLIRFTFLWIFLFWLVAALLVLAFQGRIVQRWQLPDSAGLWVTTFTVLVSLVSPLFQGLLQGRQDFFTMGWCVSLGGLLRFVIAAVAVLVLGWGSTGMILGAGLSLALGLIYAVWQTRDLWSLPREPFDGGPIVRQVMPLIFGFWACQFLFTADTMFSKAYFSGEEMAPYLAAGTMSRALLWLVLPLASVMFPKIVHSSAKAEKTDLLKLVLAGTGVLAIGGVLGLWLLGPIAVRIVYTPEYVQPTMRLLPWYAGAMVPLALANVLINDLLARGRIRVVPAIVFLAVAYAFTLPYILNHYPRKLETVLQTLGVFNLLLLGAAAWAAFGKSEGRAEPATVQSGG